ncbi:MAG: MBL fold metallo-hydrolase [Deltaproteobacteria bacterium]|nr:MBL fold metallo-hydrolase [Deltaproteobacteria bacterium]
MKVRFWGVRGSIPVPGPQTVRYGGNTACIEIEGAKKECIVFDAGSGVRLLGLDLMQRGMPLPLVNLFITHTHWDHIQGFPFFVPNYIPGTTVAVRGPVHYMDTKNLRDVFDQQMSYDYFPISNSQLAAQLSYESIGETNVNIGPITVSSQFTNHPIRSLGYRVEENGRSVFYSGDHEPYYNLFSGSETDADEDDDLLFGDIDTTVDVANQRFVDFFRGVDVAVLDCQYTPEEYAADKRSWGHSSWDYCLDWMQKAGVERMVLTHHEPLRTDDEIDRISDSVRQAAGERGIDPQRIIIAHEGLEMSV